MTAWRSAWRQTTTAEWGLLRRHRRLALAFAGLLVVPALYALICLWSLWDPASHTRALPAGLVNLDQGASYRGRELNLGAEVLAAIEHEGQFAWARYTDREAARAAVRRGELAFLLEIASDFSRRAVPGERAGAAQLTLYTSEGNHYASAGFARRFAPEVAQRVNTRLGEARWELVLNTAAGSQRNLETLRSALSDLHQGAGELAGGLAHLREGGLKLTQGSSAALDASQRLRGGAQQLADGAQQIAGGLRSLSPALRGIEARRPPDAELQALRQGSRALVDGQREAERGVLQLGAGARRLEAGLGELKTAADDVPLFGARLVEGTAALEDGARTLGDGLARAHDGQNRLLAGATRLDESVQAMAEGIQRSGATLAGATARLPEEARLDAFADGARELQRGQDALAGGLRQWDDGARSLQGGVGKLQEGAERLDSGLELLRRSLPVAVDGPGGSAQGLALSVQPVVEVVAPVANNGSALVPNFVPLALWVGAVMAAFLVHWRRLPAELVALPRSAIFAAKLALPAATVALQALGVWAVLLFVLRVPAAEPAALMLTLVVTALTFLALVVALIRVFGDLGRVLAVLLLVVQVSGAGALLPIELSDGAFQALHPWLPLTWVVRALRATQFGAFDGQWLPPLEVVAGIGCAALALAAAWGRWRGVEATRWRPPLDIE